MYGDLFESYNDLTENQKEKVDELFLEKLKSSQELNKSTIRSLFSESISEAENTV